MEVFGCTGHINLNRIKGFNEEKFCRNLSGFFKNNPDCSLLCGLADGADMLFAEEALAAGVKLYAVLPCDREEFALEHEDAARYGAAIDRAESIIVRPSEPRYVGVMNYIVRNCHTLLALWDGDETKNAAGGACDTIMHAIKAGKAVKLF